MADDEAIPPRDGIHTHQHQLPAVNEAVRDWYIPAPTSQYNGPIQDLNAFRQARNFRHRAAGVLHENSRGFLEYVYKHATVIYEAIRQTDCVTDNMRKSGTCAIPVKRMREGYWLKDDLWLMAWKVVVSPYIHQFLVFVLLTSIPLVRLA